MGLMEQLRSSRFVTELMAVQPMKATVQKTDYKAGMVARPIGYSEGVSLHATTQVLTTAVWGATNPDAFITIEGVPPTTPVIGQIAGIRGSNSPTGGVI